MVGGHYDESVLVKACSAENVEQTPDSVVDDRDSLVVGGEQIVE
jgi:hypothetical protein